MSDNSCDNVAVSDFFKILIFLISECKIREGYTIAARVINARHHNDLI